MTKANFEGDFPSSKMFLSKYEEKDWKSKIFLSVAPVKNRLFSKKAVFTPFMCEECWV